MALPEGKEYMGRKWTTFQVLKALLANYPADTPGPVRITTSVPDLHSAIAKLQNNPRYTPFIGEYVFQRRSYFPFCRELQTDLGNLELSRHLSAMNPDFITYELRDKLTKTFDKYDRSLFDAAELETLENVARDFKENVETSVIAS